jgi:hypothetical protein
MEEQILIAYTHEQIVHGVKEYESDYHMADSLYEAQAYYNGLLLDDNLYSASICGIIESTDYTTHKLLKGL